MADRIKKVAVLGMGVIGSGWVTLCAAKGYDVSAYSRKAETRTRGFETVRSNLAFLSSTGLLSEENVKLSLERIILSGEVAEAVQDADCVIESVADSYAVKKPLFKEMDRHAPAEAILASSSSGLSPTELQKDLTDKDKCIIAHPWNPPHLIPLVEVVPGEYTSRETIDRTMALMKDLRKIPCLVNKVVPGYIGNRLAAALWREAIDMVIHGVATVEDVDRALFAGPGIRWAFMGPHMIYHLGGGEAGGIGHFIDGIGNTTFHTIWKELATWDYIDDSMKAQLTDGVMKEMEGRSFKEVAGRRDEMLVKLLSLIYEH